jgi:hypothetical protein
MMKRKTALKPTSFFWVAVNAIRQAAKATPTSTANGIDRSASGERGIPNSHSTTRKTVANEPMRNAAQPSSPSTMLRMLTGVESIAS